MTAKVKLEVPATLRSLATLRMVVGGVGTRFSLGLDEMEDLHMAVEALFRVSVDLEDSARYAVAVDVADDELGLVVGPFRSPRLRERLQTAPGSDRCLDLCRLLSSVVESYDVIDHGEAFSVALVARRNPPVG